MKMSKTRIVLSALSIGIISVGMMGCTKENSAPAGGITPQVMSDSLHAVMVADRTVYTKKVVNRLVKEEKVF